MDDNKILDLLQDGNNSDLDISDFECDEDSLEQPSLLDQQFEGQNVTAPPQEPLTSMRTGRQRTLPLRKRIWKNAYYIDKLHDYSGHPEPEKILSPNEYFRDYFDESFFENTAFCTNMYFMHHTGQVLNTSSQEIKKLVGMHLIMGMLSYPRIAMYWRKHIQVEMIATAMPRDRFTTLRNALHVVPSDTPPAGPRNPLWKVQPVIDIVKSACNKIDRCPGRFSVDEQIIPFTGKCELRQSLKNKPRPVGLKNFVVTTSDGIVLDFEIYYAGNPALSDRSLGLGPAVILRLAQAIPPTSCLYFDRYFTTIPLLEALSKQNLHGTGPIMLNRLPDRVEINFKEDRNMKQGDVDQRVLDDNIALVKWKYNKGLVMASNCTGGNCVDVVKRYDKNRKAYIDVDAPRVVTSYNRYMGGVNVLDQSMEYYRTFIKTRKWTLKVILYFLDLAVVNSWRLYKCHSLAKGVLNNEIMDLMAFRFEIGESLLSTPDRDRREATPPSMLTEQASGIRKYRPGTKPSEGKRYDGYDHLPIVDEITSPRCCRLESCSSRTKIRCRKCNIYLCLSRSNDCFYLYHTQ
ncbi:unnamed protein product [Parnassius mnemosyne]|uniref:PiggyBac transposable element-derived protein domain-containing protein n=1 Tax=Parnassius mnemosyne TaxID=213953 RepID=A0AAV1KB67_9NEOP